MEQGIIIDWGTVIVSIVTLLLGGSIGWLFTIRAMRRKADGEAQQVVADSWKSVQDVYQQTIADLNGYCEDIRKDRNQLRADRDQHREENARLREKYIDMEEQIMELKKIVARQGRKIEAITPFLCGVVGCVTRSKVEITEDIEVPNEIQNEQQTESEA